MYVLLVLAFSFNMASSDYPATLTAEFSDKPACEAARAWVERTKLRSVNAVCLPKATAAP